jgi:two-component system, OmpR family, response regulator CpxR
MTKNHILIIDDDIELCDLLREYLGPEGFQIKTHNEGTRAAEKVRSGNFSLVILDVMLPGRSGFDVLRLIREHSQVPVIMLTARGDDVNRIVGLEMGADDYLPKPFNPRELLARIRAIYRRSEVQTNPKSFIRPSAGPLVVGDVALDNRTRSVQKNGHNVELTAVEFSLLETLLSQAGQIVQRDELVRIVLGRQFSPFDRSIDVHISHLRKKLGSHAGGQERIITVRGTGYQYVTIIEDQNREA